MRGLFPWKRQRKYIFVQLNLKLLLKYIMVTDHLKYNFNYNELFRGWSRLSLCWPVRMGFGPMEPVETASKCYPVPWECSVPYRVPLGWGSYLWETPEQDLRQKSGALDLGLCWCFIHHCCMWKEAVPVKVTSESQWRYIGCLRLGSELSALLAFLRLLQLARVMSSVT